MTSVAQAKILIVFIAVCELNVEADLGIAPCWLPFAISLSQKAAEGQRVDFSSIFRVQTSGTLKIKSFLFRLCP